MLCVYWLHHLLVRTACNKPAHDATLIIRLLLSKSIRIPEMVHSICVSPSWYCLISIVSQAPGSCTFSMATLCQALAMTYYVSKYDTLLALSGLKYCIQDHDMHVMIIVGAAVSFWMSCTCLRFQMGLAAPACHGTGHASLTCAYTCVPRGTHEGGP